MSIFGRIANRIFGRASAAEAPATPTPAGAPPATGSAMGGGSAASGAGAAAATTPSMATPGMPGAMGAAPAPATGQPVDVEAVVGGMAAGKGLNWKTSIVDLMKVLDIDSSLDARKELATELGYTGAKDGSAEMNIWLHKAVMKKLAENGGIVPASLRD